MFFETSKKIVLKEKKSNHNRKESQGRAHFHRPILPTTTTGEGCWPFYVCVALVVAFRVPSVC
jgi:hypothetical protein